MTGPRICLVLRALDGGGMQRSMLKLGQDFVARGCRVTLLVAKPDGPMRAHVPAGVELVPLAAEAPLPARRTVLRLLGREGLPLIGLSMPSMLRHLAALSGELRRLRPQAVLARGTQSNLAALWARQLSGIDTRVVACECTTLSVASRRSARRFRRAYPALVARHYPAAEAIVAVSRAVAADLATTTGLSQTAITTIPNGVGVDIAATGAVPDHPWLHDEVPLVLAVGRLHWQKDFATLLGAFAALRRRRPARLVLLGEGPQRAELERLAGTLGITAAVHFAGFVDNPFAWMTRASVLALTSLSEGFGNVLVEALACGLPVVSTDCPGGPREILADGRFGALVPVGDTAGLADALDRTIADRPDAALLQARAADFSLAQASGRYLDVLLGRMPHAA